MLKFISIQNFALIERLEIDFEQGLNLLTGETGSGKSILVDAVGLLVGERASVEMIRQGSQSASIEGIFGLNDSEEVLAKLKEIGDEGSGEELIVRRELARNGNNKVFINGRLATQGFLAELGALLADIHGQHQQQLLLHPSHQLQALDAYGENQDRIDHLDARFQKWQQVNQHFNQIRDTQSDRLQRLDLLDFQIRDIEKLDLSPGIDRQLEEEKSLLSSARKRAELAAELYSLIYEDEVSALSLWSRVEKRMEELARLDATLQEELEQLPATRFFLEELGFRLRGYSDEIAWDPQRLTQIQERLADIQMAKRKYGGSIQEILAYAESISLEQEKLSQNENDLETLEKEVETARQEYLEQARELSRKRLAAAQELKKEVERELGELGMEKTRFQILLETCESSPGRQGIDRVEFLISPNPGEEPRPLRKIASGGELSRVMLALKSILNVEGERRTLIFDEVDSGIGGRIASSLGEKLARLARRHQVFCVTHLPQIAAYADQHFHVRKTHRDGRTRIEILPLAGDKRVEELSRMLAGEKVTDITRRHAREMLAR